MKKSFWCYAVMSLVMLFSLSIAALFPFFSSTAKASSDTEYAASTALPAELSGLFTDYTMTSLSSPYQSMDDLETFEAQVDPDGVKYAAFFNRAEEIIKGNITYEKGREFSSKFSGENHIEQCGNIYSYSTQTLRFGFGASDIQVTGIYGIAGQSFTIFVDCPDSNKLPEILLAQSFGTYEHYRHTVYLSKGMNTFTFYNYTSYGSEVCGGAVYIVNPYTAEQQKDVSIYIEGGGYYPVFYKDGNERQFLDGLKEYEERRASAGAVDMAELITDNAIFTTTSSSLYKAYIERNIISPQKNLELWGDYMRKTFEFNGIPLDEDSAYSEDYNELNNHVRLNFRYMHMISGAGAFTYFRLIAYVSQLNWFANFYDPTNPIDPENRTGEREIFDVGHEIGHAIDTSNRTFAETTNNVNGTFAYLQIMNLLPTKWTPFSQSHEHLSSDYTNDFMAYDDGNVLYVQTPENSYHDHNHMMWYDLESVFPGYWGRLNNYFRKDTLSSRLNPNEQMVYYSSLATGVNLSDYFERWGVFMIKGSQPMKRYEYASAGSYFKSLLQNAIDSHIIEDKPCAHYWYADSQEYEFSLKNKDVVDRAYKGAAPQITSIDISNEGGKQIRYVSFSGELDPSHLCYEIYSSTDDRTYSLAGFSWSTSFRDDHQYAETPYYKVRAVNRFFEVSDFSAAQSNASSTLAVASLNGETYGTLQEAISNAALGDTIFLLDNCSLEHSSFVNSITFKIDPSVRRDITLTATGSSIMFQLTGGQNIYTFEGNEHARLIIDGGGSQRLYPCFYAGWSNIVTRYVTFQNWQTSMATFGSAIYSFGNDASIVLEHTSFINCSGGRGSVVLDGHVSLKDCTFEGNSNDLYLTATSSAPQLTFVDGVSSLAVVFSSVDENHYFACQGFEPSLADIGKLSTPDATYEIILDANGLGVGQYNFELVFIIDGKEYNYTLKNRYFTFGSEKPIDGATGLPFELDERYYISSYTEQGTENVHSVGDSITLTNGMTFVVEKREKASITLQLASGAKNQFLIEGKDYYLPRFDDNNSIVWWSVGGQKYPAGTTYKAKSGDVLVPGYLGLYRYEFYDGQDLYQYGYQSYGQMVSTPVSSSQSSLSGWVLGEDVIEPGQSFKLLKDTKLYSVSASAETYDLAEAEIELDGEEFSYTGSKIVPQIQVKIGGQPLPEGYYHVEITGNLNVGQATIVVTPANKLVSGQAITTFTISPRELTSEQVEVDGLEDLVYSGQIISVSPKFSWQDMVLVEGQDYNLTLSPSQPKNAGQGSVSVELKGNFSGNISYTFVIAKATLRALTAYIDDWTYGHAESEPEFDAGIFTSELAGLAKFSYSSDGLSWSENVPKLAGTYFIKVDVTGSANINDTSSQPYQFTIMKAEIDERPQLRAEVGYDVATLEQVHILPNGWAWRWPSQTLDYGQHQYTAVWQDEQNYMGPYTSSVIVVRALRPISLASVAPLAENPVYSGQPITLNLELEENGQRLEQNRHFVVDYQDNVRAGHATARITGIGIYTGITTFDFTIEQAPAPFDLPSKILRSRADQTLADVSLPAHWRWENSTLAVDGLGSARIVYTNQADSANFKQLTFEVELALKPITDITHATINLEFSRYDYTGSAVTPRVRVVVGGQQLTEGRDYRLQYQDNVRAGMGKVLVIGLNDYEGTAIKEFEISTPQDEKSSKPWFLLLISGAFLVVGAALIIWQVVRIKRKKIN